MTARRFKSRYSAGQRKADTAAWGALVQASMRMLADPLNASFAKLLSAAADKAKSAQPPTPYTPGGVWAELYGLARRFVGETLYARTQLAEELFRAAEACAPFLAPPPPGAPPGGPPPRPRADIDG